MTIDDLLSPQAEPVLVYPTERITCQHFTSATPELVHHAAILSASPPYSREGRGDPWCGTCAREIPAQETAAFCGLCHRPVCAVCIAQDQYAPMAEAYRPLDADEHGPLLEWNQDRRDFLIREIKEQTWNFQEGKCGQCGQPLQTLSETSIAHGPRGPWLICDHPCANIAAGNDQLPALGVYPPNNIRIVHDPRHNMPEDWLNVHYEFGMPEESDEVWAKADCRFAIEVSADPERWEFVGECAECLMYDRQGNVRPHKWHTPYFLLTEKPDPRDPDAPRQRLNAQALLDWLGNPDWAPTSGITINSADPGCLDYYGIPRRPQLL